MQRILWIFGAGALCASAFAQEVGTVISAQPVVQQVAVPRQVCHTEQQVSTPPRSGAGAVIGAIAGGLVGSAIGGGSGHALATAAGVVGGAVAGHQIEGQPQVQTVQNCSTQTFYENRAVYYDVVYEYAGKRYTVQMPQDPGPTVQLQVTPVMSAPPPPVQAPAPARIISSTTYVQPPLEQVTVLPPATVYQTAPIVTSGYGPSSFVAPLAIGLGIGYVSGHYGRRYYNGPPRYGYRPYWRR